MYVYMCILAQISDQCCLFTVKALKARIESCRLQPSGVSKGEVEGVYKTTLGQCSLAWLRALKPSDILLAQGASALEMYDALRIFSQGLVVCSEISLYPYVYNFYFAGKAMYIPCVKKVNTATLPYATFLYPRPTLRTFFYSVVRWGKVQMLNVEQGVAQGCSLSPILFSVVMNARRTDRKLLICNVRILFVGK